MERKKHEVWALGALVVTLLIFFSLFSFHSSDPTSFSSSPSGQDIQNWIGVFGANTAWCLFFLFGLGAYALPLLGLWISWTLLRGISPLPHGPIQVAALAVLGLSFISLLALNGSSATLFGRDILTGGQLGLLIARGLSSAFDILGAYIFLCGMFLIGLILATPLSLKTLAHHMLCGMHTASSAAAKLLARLLALLLRRKLPDAQDLRQLPAEEERPYQQTLKRLPRNGNNSRKRKNGKPQEQEPEELPESERLLPPPPPRMKIVKKEPKGEDPAFQVAPASPPGQYTLPPLSLLDAYEEDIQGPDPKTLEENARILEGKLADFGVQGKVVDICPGPVITMYEYAPAPGIKISRIVSLSDDLSMALRAMSIRVVAPIPGKAAIGIEIPNAERELVFIRAVLESQVFSASSAPLTMALGKDITGLSAVANLGKMPHLLIAGATGTGKSVCINTILSSLLYRNTPDELRLLLIDPKRIELSTYEGIPHLIHPVVTDPKLATKALRWAVQEMELRYKLLADKSSRNIEGYNKVLAREKAKAQSAEPKPEEAAERESPFDAPAVEEPVLKHHHLPYIVIIIDELADLMMVASREVEESITRLAQMARAAGIHLILATQRPSVDVLTGIIKANVPTRISFQVSSRIDSRTILDTMGAENLLGSGDMLFLPPGTAKLQRIHGAFISESEVQKLTEFWRSQQLKDDPLRERVNFQEQFSSEDIAEEELDEKYEEAIRLVCETRQASISMLQRRLRVGYNRAARMIEMMEMQGIVGPSDGVKPREVLGPSTD